MYLSLSFADQAAFTEWHDEVLAWLAAPADAGLPDKPGDAAHGDRGRASGPPGGPDGTRA